MISDDSIGRYEIQQGRRILYSTREGSIRQWEEIGHAKADATGKTFFVVETRLGQITLTDSPGSLPIVRVCAPIPSKR